MISNIDLETNQYDIMYSSNSSICPPNDNVNLSFKHLLSQVVFNITEGDGITVSSLSLNAKFNGTIYVDDVVDEFINALAKKENKNGDYCFVSVVHEIKLGKIDFIKIKFTILIIIMGLCFNIASFFYIDKKITRDAIISC